SALVRAAPRRRGAPAVHDALPIWAEQHRDALMPAYTHLQRAQPVSVAHWFLAHFWPLARDRGRMAAARRAAAVLPLGSGAVAGTDRKSTRLNSSHGENPYAVFCLE